MVDTTTIDFAIIGSGNMANFLAEHLVKRKLNLTQIHSRNTLSGNSLSERVNCTFEADINSINAAVIFVAVTDNQVLKILRKLPLNSIVLSTSGVINLAKSSHPNSGVFYPLQTLSSTNYSDTFSGPILLEAKNEMVSNYLVQLCKKLHFKHKFTRSIERKNIHLIAVFFNNFINHIACTGFTEATKRGIDRALLKPLMEKTFKTILADQSCENQSGPAKRNDKKTINQHLELLDGETKKLYKSLTKSILSKHGHKL